jgi:hypothetical protein
VPLPKPHPDEVRIKVVAAGVAFGDIQLRKGDYSEFVCVPENELIPDYSTCPAMMLNPGKDWLLVKLFTYMIPESDLR